MNVSDSEAEDDTGAEHVYGSGFGVGDLSGDGGLAFFTSAGTTLDPAAAANGATDTFLRDRVAGTTEVVGLAQNGSVPALGSRLAGASRDGRFVAFTTNSSLDPADTDAFNDLYLRNRLAGTTALIGGPSSGSSTAEGGFTGQVSDDGRFVLLRTSSGLLRHDAQAPGAPAVVAATPGGTPGTSTSRRGSMTADGRFVTFIYDGGDLIPGDVNGQADVYRKDLLTGAVVRISTGTIRDRFGNVVGLADGSLPIGTPRISADGSVIAYTGPQGVLVDDGSGELLQLSSGRIGGLSDSGDVVAFSTGESLVAADVPPVGCGPGAECASDAYAFARSTGSVTLVSTNTIVPADGLSDAPRVSGDGATVAFISLATNLIGSDSNGAADVFARSID